MFLNRMEGSWYTRNNSIVIKTYIQISQSGISRAPAIVIAFLMEEFQTTYKKAYDYVKKKRRFIRPNKSNYFALLSTSKLILFCRFSKSVEILLILYI